MLLKLGKVLHGMQKRKEEERGFTLIELLVVVIIIGILAAIAIPTFLNQRENAQNASVTSDARNAATEVQSLATQANGNYSGITLAQVQGAVEESDGNSVSSYTGTANEFTLVVTGLNGSVTFDSDGGGIQPFAPTTP